MKSLDFTRLIVLVFLAFPPIVYSSTGLVTGVNHAPNDVPTIEPWSPDLRSSNITSLSQFPMGSEFPVRVNVTNAGPITGFDIYLRYNITTGPNVLQAVNTGTELSGGLLDPDNPPAGCTILVLRGDIDIPPGLIRFAAVLVGGCTVDGTGTLFTTRFRVVGIGATSIELVRTNASGRRISLIVGGAPQFPELPFQAVDAYFRNKLGLPPVVSFSNFPFSPVFNETVRFDASQTYDPDNSTGPDRGIRRYLWTFGDYAIPSQAEGVRTDHVFVLPFNLPTTGNFTVRLVAWDFDNNLPAVKVVVINVAAGIKQASSLNWSGFAVPGPAGSVTDIKGSWVVPAIVGPCPSFDEHSSFWVGIDGLTSPTVEQTGTESACVNGVPTYFAWYEFFPRPAIMIRQMKISPGDVMSAEVEFVNGKFNASITDSTTGVSFSKTMVVKGAERSSAEWIAEAPSSRLGILPLANFGAVSFGKDYTGVGETCTTTVSGITGTIGSFGAGVVMMKMIDRSFQTKALPSSLTADQSSFRVIWLNAL